MRFYLIIAGLSVAISTCNATTLQRLGFDDMTRQSTAIVRARVSHTSAISRGPDIFTVYNLDILENLKSANGSKNLSLAVPGGVANGLRQVVAGAPTLQTGSEYVLFLWTGRSGLTQLIGLSQGLFDVRRSSRDSTKTASITTVHDSTDAAVVVRVAANDQMLDEGGHLVQPEAISMKWGDLKGRVTKVLAEGAPVRRN